VTWRRRLPAVAIGVALAIGATSCGLPQDKDPQPIAGALPPNLRQRDNAPSTDPTRTTEQVLYFVEQSTTADATEVLYPIRRSVPMPRDPGQLPRLLLLELLKRPSTTEGNGGLSTDIPASLDVLDVTTNGDTVTVDLNGLNVQGPRLPVAVAQIVYTLTELHDISKVLFYANGSPTPMPVEDGSVDQGVPVTRSSFGKLGESIDSTGLEPPSAEPPAGIHSPSATN
jgi:spore germination protein GerM